jgi:hypothetical protein
MRTSILKGEKMTIAKNIEDVQLRIRGGDKDFGARLREAAIDAILAGMTHDGKPTPAWEKYMTHFQKNSKELARLTTDKTDCDPYTKTARAYLVGHGLCLPITEKNMMDGIADNLDATITGVGCDDSELDNAPKSAASQDR